LEVVEQPKKSPKNPGNHDALSDALPMSRFQNFAADAAGKITALSAVFRNLFFEIRFWKFALFNYLS